MSPALKAKELQEESSSEPTRRQGEEEEASRLIQVALSKLEEGTNTARRARGAASRLRSVCTSK